jgi:hypothetical protein
MSSGTSPKLRALAFNIRPGLIRLSLIDPPVGAAWFVYLASTSPLRQDGAGIVKPPLTPSYVISSVAASDPSGTVPVPLVTATSLAMKLTFALPALLMAMSFVPTIGTSAARPVPTVPSSISEAATTPSLRCIGPPIRMKWQGRYLARGGAVKNFDVASALRTGTLRVAM